MKILTQTGLAAALRVRIEALRPESTRKWGKMSVGGMLCHLDDAYRGLLRRDGSVEQPAPWAGRCLLRPIALHVPLRWPHGLPTPSEVDQLAGAEGIEKAGMWRNAFTRHRCLVPADSFFEWHKIRAKNNPKYEITMTDGEPFAFAGLWGAWYHPGTTEWLQSFTIITTDPNELMERIHTRMPVILHPNDYDRWLSRAATDQPPIDLLRPFEAERMRADLTENSVREMFVEPNSL